MTIPSYHQVVALPREQGPLVVPESFEDENGHMNVRHYFDLCTAAIGVLFERIGVDDEYRTTRRQGFFIAEHHIRYFAETAVRDRVSVHSLVIERSTKVVHAMALLVNDTTEQLACTLEMVAINVDFGNRRSTGFDADIAAAIDAELDSAARVACPVPLCHGMGIRA
ncbi:thioesterase [Nocardia panacis]|uniref:Thioesterase n=1 Tax=Nocardia panacis TaxID=2340916 RepID=A0A3A4KJN9_9NOCA|nr:thioesterase family protein [Nocardia panacis]RJO75122.1 thioesterase [Nocardia panacis]